MIYFLKQKKMATQEKITNLDDLHEWIADISSTDRQKGETAKTISDTLQDIVDEQNKKAIWYKKDFRQRLDEKLERTIRKKYFPGKNKTDILIEAKKNKETQEKLGKFRKESDAIKKDFQNNRKEKHRIYETLKRAFNKEITHHGWEDIDKEAGLFILKLAKFFELPNNKDDKDIKDDKNVKYNRFNVEYGKRGKKWVTYDTWGTRNGMEIIPNKQTITSGKAAWKTYLSLFNALAIIDEHDKSDGAKNINKPTSSTHMMYNILNDLKVFNPKYKDQIKRFVDFVDKVDSLYYQIGSIDQNANNRTVFHLHKMIPIENIYRYFNNPKNTWFEVLSEKDIQELWIAEMDIKKSDEKIKETIKTLQELEGKGRYGGYNLERFIFAIGKELRSWQAVSWYYDCWIFHIFESGDLYMYSPRPLPEKVAGFSTTGHFLIIKNISYKDLDKIMDIFKPGRDSDPNLKQDFLAFRKEQIEREQEKAEKEKDKEEKMGMIEKMKEIPLEKLQKNKTYTAIINNVSGKIIFVNISPTIRGRIKFETKQEKIHRAGDQIKVKIIEFPENINELKEGKLLSLEIISTPTKE